MIYQRKFQGSSTLRWKHGYCLLLSVNYTIGNSSKLPISKVFSFGRKWWNGNDEKEEILFSGSIINRKKPNTLQKINRKYAFRACNELVRLYPLKLKLRKVQNFAFGREPPSTVLKEDHIGNLRFRSHSSAIQTLEDPWSHDTRDPSFWLSWQ